jgi:hypothetical protein
MTTYENIKKREEYSKTYTSFAGTDIVVSVTMPPEYGGNSYVLGELQTISYSIHREVSPVRALGHVNPLGFTAGPRTIAGSLIFTVFDRSVVTALKDLILGVNKILTENNTYKQKKWKREGLLDKTRASSLEKNAILMDELPPFDIIITMANEYGQASYLIIQGLVIVDEGQVMSIEDVIVENTYSYMARNITPLMPYEV